MTSRRFKSGIWKYLLIVAGVSVQLSTPGVLTAQATRTTQVTQDAEVSEPASQAIHDSSESQTVDEGQEAAHEDAEGGHADAGHGEATPIWLTLPFVVLLVMIATGPLFF